MVTVRRMVQLQQYHASPDFCDSHPYKMVRGGQTPEAGLVFFCFARVLQTKLSNTLQLATEVVRRKFFGVHLAHLFVCCLANASAQSTPLAKKSVKLLLIAVLSLHAFLSIQYPRKSLNKFMTMGMWAPVCHQRLPQTGSWA